MSRLPGEKDGGEIILIDKLMAGDIVVHKTISSYTLLGVVLGSDIRH